MAAFRAFSFMRVAGQIKLRKDSARKADYNNEEYGVSQMSTKAFRRHWLKARSRAIWVSVGSVLACQALYKSSWGIEGTAYIQLYWRRLKELIEPSFKAPKCARDTILRNHSLDPALQDNLTDWFLRMDIVRQHGVSGAWLKELLAGSAEIDAIPSKLLLNDFLSVVSKTKDPKATYERLQSASESYESEYTAMRLAMEKEKESAARQRLLYLEELQRQEDNTYLRHFQAVGKVQLGKLVKKIKKRPKCVRLPMRKALLESALAEGTLR